MSDLGRPVRIKYIPSLAFVATRGRPATDRPPKPPGKNWAKTFERRHPEIVLVGKDDKRNYRGARVQRTTVTAVECISADGRYLNPLIIWPATTHRSNWTTFPTPGWHYACNESGYTDSNISLQWLKRVFDPETKERANGRPRVLILDGSGTHETLEILEYCFANNIILCRLPSHTSHKTQPCDVAVFRPLKTAYRVET